MKTKCLALAAMIIAAASFGSAQSKSGIHKVDFKNYDYGTLCGGPHKFLAVTGNRLVLKNGHAEQGDAGNYTDLGSVQYVDISRDGREQAFVVINGQTSGSSNGYRAAYVFAYQNGRAKQLWTKCEENSTAELKGRNIIFTSPDWLPTDAHCCFSYILTEAYGWRGGKIALISRRRRSSSQPEASPTKEAIEQMAAEIAAAFAAGNLGSLDAEKPYLGRVTLIVKQSLGGPNRTKSFTNLKLAGEWLRHRQPDINLNAAELKQCRSGVCTFVENGLLHNNLYLTKFTYGKANGRLYLKTIYILDGD